MKNNDLKHIKIKPIKIKNLKQKTVIFSCFLLGIITSIYLKSLDPNNIYLSLANIKEIEYKIDSREVQIANLENLISKTKNESDKYKDAVENDDISIEDVLDEERNNLKAVSGNVDLEGQGIKIVLKDSDKDVTEGQNPNDLLVHDMDVLRIINDLKGAGAEAISINGERLLSSSRIKCAGPTITINKTTYGQPFVINAIGEKEVLSASVQAPGSYGYLLKEVYGLYIDVKENNDIIIPKYSGN
jgi:uncharacterized protein YlxW (UPF0749 family)